jgi:hypothetical protein
MICKRCNNNKPDDKYVNCENCREHSRELYTKRKLMAGKNIVLKNHVTEMTILSMCMVNILNSIINTDKQNVEVFHNMDIIHNDLHDNCSICLCDIYKNESMYNLKCHHKFHTHCLIPNLKVSNTCPICRTEITPKNDTQDLFAACDDIVNRLIRVADNIFTAV